MKEPTLLVLAAGMGSRYGGLKQVDSFGPNGETLLEYSIYDAIQAGFKKVVFVIKKSFAPEFEEKVIQKIKTHIKVETVFQEIEDVPVSLPSDFSREKPWGTCHAVYVARKLISEPFMIINADDYYGRNAYKLAYDAFKKGTNYFVVGYKLRNTISENGSVNRGICHTNKEGFITEIKEVLNIMSQNGKMFYEENGKEKNLSDGTIASMNMIGFDSDFFEHSERFLKTFLAEKLHVPKSEALIPTLLDEINKENGVEIKLIETDEKWLGVTYEEDKATVQDFLISTIAYPKKMFA